MPAPGCDGGHIMFDQMVKPESSRNDLESVQNLRSDLRTLEWKGGEGDLSGSVIKGLDIFDFPVHSMQWAAGFPV